LVSGKFIEVWRQKEAALQSSRLTRLLLANSAHEVRTPLNAIINYLEIALEGSLDQETRDNLAKSHSASKSLIYVINDLLDLTKTEEGQNLIKDEIFDLHACIFEATEPFKVDAKRKGIKYEVVEHPGLPSLVYGDNRRVRQAVANVTANAVQHTDAGSVVVEMFVSEVVGRRARIEILVEDTGKGMDSEQVDALFRELEQVSTDIDESKPSQQADGQPGDERTLGLGLAVVARIVRTMDGQLRLKSELGKGTRFAIQLPFDLPDESPEPGDPSNPPYSAAGSSVASISTSLPLASEGEIMLVDRGSSSTIAESILERPPVSETISISSQKSAGSKDSVRSSKGDADRLIDAIQTPLSLRDQLQRQNSKNEHVYQDSEIFFTSAVDSIETGSGQKPPLAGQANEGLRHLPSEKVGFAVVADAKTPIRAIKILDEFRENSKNAKSTESPQPGVPVSEKPMAPLSDQGTTTSTSSQCEGTKLHVLIAEDDPINMKILRKRLEKARHEVYHAVNGEDCATVYRERPSRFDVILMDMQVSYT
jgi:nitrogen-specific signal transduction histidine kinase